MSAHSLFGHLLSRYFADERLSINSVTATSIIRLGYIVTIDYHHDFSFRTVPPTFLAAIEPPETIICVSLPMIYSLWTRVGPSKRGKDGSAPHLGGPGTPTHGSSFGRGLDSHKQCFSQLHNNLPDPFELAESKCCFRYFCDGCSRRTRSSIRAGGLL